MAKQLLGYRLHDARLNYKGGSGVMRTIKYPLSFSTSEEKEKVISALKNDYRALCGDINVDDFLNSLKGGKTHSAIDFWQDSLKLGGVFAPSGRKLINFLEKTLSRKSNLEEVLGLMEQKVGKKLKIEGVKDLFSKGSLRSTSIKGLPKKIKDCFEDISEEEAQKIAEDALMGGVPQALSWLKNYFGYSPIRVFEIPKTLGELTFALLPEKYRRENLSDFLRADLEVMGLSDNGNAFSNFFGVFIKRLCETTEQTIDECTLFLKQFVSLSQAEEQEIRERYEQLARKAGLLNNPRFGTGWKEYRLDLSGKLSSWVENNANHKKRIHEETEKAVREWDSIIDFVAPERADLRELCLEAKGLAEEILSGDFSKLPVYKELVSSLRDQLNLWYQKHEEEMEDQDESEEDSEKAKEIDKKFPGVFSKLRAQARFFGEGRKEVYLSLLSSPKKIVKGFRLLREIEEKLELNQGVFAVEDERKVRKLAQRIFRLAERMSDQARAEKLRLLLDDQFAGRPSNKCAYFVYKNQRFSLILFRRDYKSFATDLLLKLAGIFEDRYEVTLGNLDDARDKLDFIKLYFSLMMRNYSGNLGLKIDKNLFSRFALLYEVHLRKPSREKLLFAINSGLLSDLSGAIATVSRQSFIVRHSIQLSNGKQAALAIKAENTGNHFENILKKPEVKLKLAAGNPRYYYAIRLSGYKTESQASYFLITKDFSGKPNECIFGEVTSSKYQVQFLDWVLRRPKKKNFDLEVSGSFLIGETTYKIDWDFNNFDNLPTLTTEKEEIYVSQPFRFVPAEKKGETSEERSRVLGVDIGERALAWSVLEKDSNKVSVIDKGYIHDPQFMALRRGVQNLKKRQQKGTFLMPSSYVARLRESLAHSLRNKVHSLALKYKVAKIAYEREISAFETGGEKIRKVYHTLKVTDIFGNNSAEKSQRENIWGKPPKGTTLMGSEVRAKATSQICSKCRKWYKKENPASENLKKIIRPPVGYYDDNYIWHRADNMPENITEDFYKKRGNSAVFICPLCHHIADADIQASFMIGLKQILRSEKGGNHVYKFDEWLAEIASLDFEPITF